MEHLIKKAGFTLVELLVSIAIIATLTAILLPNFMGARERAKDTQKIQDMAAIKNALRAYYNDYQTYPGDDDDVLDIDIVTTMNDNPKDTVYIQTVGIGYSYYRTNGGDGFNLRAYLDSGQGDDDLNSQTRCGTGTSVDKLYVVCAN